MPSTFGTAPPPDAACPPSSSLTFFSNAIIFAAASDAITAFAVPVVPIIFPGVAENQSRLRFFITSRHSPQQIDGALDAVAAELPKVLNAPSFMNLIAGR